MSKTGCIEIDYAISEHISEQARASIHQRHQLELARKLAALTNDGRLYVIQQRDRAPKVDNQGQEYFTLTCIVALLNPSQAQIGEFVFLDYKGSQAQITIDAGGLKTFKITPIGWRRVS